MVLPKRDSRTQPTADVAPAAPDLLGAALPAWARWTGQSLLLSLHVQPGARRTGVVGAHGTRLKLALHAPPVDGKANEELLAYLAGELRLRRRTLTLVAGQASREKSVAIQTDAVTAARIAVQLEGAAESEPGSFVAAKKREAGD